MDELTARAVLVLHASRQFDSFDIAVLLTLPEHQVTRLVQASRDVIRELAPPLLAARAAAAEPPQGAA